MQHFDLNQYRSNRSAFKVDNSDISWAESVLYDNATANWCKNNPTDYYTNEGYFPPNCKKLGDKLAIINYLKLKDPIPLSILDIGAGAGQFIKLCAELGHNVQGTEIQEVLDTNIADIYKHYNVDMFELTIIKNTQIVLPKTYDVITLARTVFDSNYSASDWIKFRDNLFEYLNPKGRLFIKTNLKFYKDKPGNVLPEIVQAFGVPIIGWNSYTYCLEL